MAENTVKHKHFSDFFICSRYILGLLFSLSSILGVLLLSLLLIHIIFVDIISLHQFLISFFVLANNFYPTGMFLKGLDYYGFNEVLATASLVMSFLLVTFPLYLVTLYYILKEEKSNSAILVQSYSRNLYYIINVIVLVIVLLFYLFFFTTFFLNGVLNLVEVIKLFLVLFILIPAIIFHLSFLKNLSIKSVKK